MTTAWGGVLPEGQSTGDSLQYLMAAAWGVIAGWIDVRVGLGFARPRKPWRWVVLVGIFVPIIEWLAYAVLAYKPERAQIYESLLSFLPAIVGAYGGAFGRTVVNNLLANK